MYYLLLNIGVGSWIMKSLVLQSERGIWEARQQPTDEFIIYSVLNYYKTKDVWEIPRFVTEQGNKLAWEIA